MFQRNLSHLHTVVRARELSTITEDVMTEASQPGHFKYELGIPTFQPRLWTLVHTIRPAISNSVTAIHTTNKGH